MINKIFIVVSEWLPLIAQGTLMTLAVSTCALGVGLIFGTFLGIWSCNKLKRVFWGSLINFYVLIMRGTPLYVQALIVYYVLPEITGINLSPFGAAILTLGCNSTAYITEVFRGGINTVSAGQWDAAHVLGYSQFKTLTHIIMPQAIKNILPALVNESISLIKESSIFAAIGLVELTRVAVNINAKTLDTMNIYLCIALIYLFLTTTISLFAKKLEKNMEVGHDIY